MQENIPPACARRGARFSTSNAGALAKKRSCCAQPRESGRRRHGAGKRDDIFPGIKPAQFLSHAGCDTIMNSTSSFYESRDQTQDVEKKSHHIGNSIRRSEFEPNDRRFSRKIRRAKHFCQHKKNDEIPTKNCIEKCIDKRQNV